jgi:hypothetical protein
LPAASKQGYGRSRVAAARDAALKLASIFVPERMTAGKRIAADT